MPNPKHPPSAERIREVFDYESTTGKMTRKVRRGNNGPVGKVVGSDGGQGYLYVSLDHGRYLLHRLSWTHYYGEWPTQVIDHIDGNGHNNAISNLRDVAHRANSDNMIRNKNMRADAAKWRAHQADAQLLAAEVERLRADAERYRWLRNEAHPDRDDTGIAVSEQDFNDWGNPFTRYFSGEALDAALDASRLALKDPS